MDVDMISGLFGKVGALKTSLERKLKQALLRIHRERRRNLNLYFTPAKKGQTNFRWEEELEASEVTSAAETAEQTESDFRKTSGQQTVALASNL